MILPSVLAIVFIAIPATTIVAQEKNIVASYFTNIAQGYEDYGFVYSFSSGFINWGMKEPENYSEESLAGKDVVFKVTVNSITTTPKIGNLKGSFDLCDVFYRESGKCIDKRLVDLYMWYSVMMYYWTLQTLASPIYYKDKSVVLFPCEMSEL